ncbi:uncharacterized protein [Haliotis asinina]|uniref:uncharacterized protein isoform X2 n=1 Tax=Haliotis asinina TaxID=109174 RepID=UPI003531C497
MMIRLLVYCLVHTVTMSAMKLSLTSCPSPILDKWKEYDERCKQESPARRFHCQYDASEDKLFSACAVASKCGPGTHAHIDMERETVSCVSCSDMFYQQHGKMSFEYTQPNCDYKKKPCAEGKFQCEPSSSQQDYKCSCDHQMGYVPNKAMDCDCFEYDSICDCQYSPCADGQQLSANYSCVAVPATTTSQIREPTTTSEPAGVSPNTGAIIGTAIGSAAVIIVLAIICYCIWSRRQQIIKNWSSSGRSFPCCQEKTDTTDCSSSLIDWKKPACPTAPPDENSHPDDGQHTSGQTAEGPSEGSQSDEGQSERGQSDEGQSERKPIVEESTLDRSRDRLAVGTSAGESVMRDTELTVSENRMRERLKALGEAPIQHGALNINAKNVIVGPQGAIVEQQGALPAENNFHNLQVDMPYSDSFHTYPEVVETEVSDVSSEDCIHEDDTEVKQPFIKDKHPRPEGSLQNGNQSLIPSPV